MPSVTAFSPTPIAFDAPLIADYNREYSAQHEYTPTINSSDVKDDSIPRDFVLEQLTNPLLSLDIFPTEILELIFYHVLMSSGAEGQRNLAKLLPICSRFYQIGVPMLYRHVTISYSRSFGAFRRSIEETGFGEFVKVLNFSSFTSVGLGRTGNMNKEIQNLTSSTILRVLELCPNLEEFLACESIDQDLDARVLDKLVNMPSLVSLDFCGSIFADALMSSSFVQSSAPLYNLRNLSLHGCSTIPSAALGRLLPRLVNIERLDLTHTLVESDALLSIPETARLTHLSLGRCNQLKSNGLVKFLLLHPASRNLVWLNMMFDVSKPSPLSKEDYETILRYLPHTLEYLNLYGLPVETSYLKYLTKLPRLAGLSLGYSSLSAETLYQVIPKFKHLRYLDLSGNPNISLWVLHDTRFYQLNPNLEVVELRNDRVEKVLNTTIGEGWIGEVGQGRRGWIYKMRTGQKLRTSTAAKSPRSFNYKLRSGGPISKTALLDRIQWADQTIVEEPKPSVETNEAWILYASRKINMNTVGLGGYDDFIALKQRGIYGYYAYHLN